MELQPSSQSGNQQDLLSRIYNKDKTAEQSLVEFYYKQLFFILRSQTKDSDLAKDLCQDTFIIVLNKARQGEIKNPQGLTSFIRSVGINLLIDYKRKIKRQQTDATEEFAHISDALSPNLDQRVEKQRIVELIVQVINELPSQRDADILRLTYIALANKTDICSELTLSSEHYDRVLYRAKQRLNQLLATKLKLNVNTMSMTEILTIGAMIFVFCESISAFNVREPLMSYHVKEYGYIQQYERVNH